LNLFQRPRRTATLGRMVRKTTLTVDDPIYPMFVIEGECDFLASWLRHPGTLVVNLSAGLRATLPQRITVAAALDTEPIEYTRTKSFS
jgi:hypothetical protein